MAEKRKKTTKKAVKKTVKKKTVKKKATKKAVKKAAKKAVKKTAKKAVKKNSKRLLSAADRRTFKNALLQKRREIFQNVFEIEGEALKKSRLDASGDLSSMPIHMADLGTDNYEQEFALDLMDSERRILHEIDDALQRLDEGTYGVCEGTGEPIPKARLHAQPWARYCVEYARLVEEGRAEGHR